MSAQNRTEKVLAHLSPMATAATGAAPVNVVVTGACGNIAYAILFMIAQGELLGPTQRINLRLLDIPPMAENLKGVAMEITDCAFPLINEITSTTDYAVAFNDADICMLIGARPRGPGMDRADLLKANASIFAGQGKAINDYAKKSVKCLVVGNPANTNAYIAMMNAPSIPQSAFHAMTRLDHNRAVGQVANKLSVSADSVKNIIIWGNHSNTMYPDLSSALIVNSPSRGQVTPALAAINDKEWVAKTFIDTVALRGGAIIKARGKSSAASAAKAAVDHVHDWCLGTRKGEWVAMAVPSDGSYGVPKGLIFSFPCVAANGHYKIVQGVRVDAEAQKRIQANITELEDEKKAAGY
jgi:malate dehydrogenase